MKNKTKILILVLTLVLAIACVSLIFLFKDNDKQVVDNTKESNVVEEVDTKQEKAVEEKPDTFDDVKDKLGHGKNGNVVKVEEGKDTRGNRTYTLTTSNGNQQTITVRKKEQGDANDEVDTSSAIVDNPKEEPDIPPIELGTAYEEFIAMSNEDQVAFYYSFETADEFFKWYDKALEEYKSLNPTIVVGEDEVIDFGN